MKFSYFESLMRSFSFFFSIFISDTNRKEEILEEVAHSARRGLFADPLILKLYKIPMNTSYIRIFEVNVIYSNLLKYEKKIGKRNFL